MKDNINGQKNKTPDFMRVILIIVRRRFDVGLIKTFSERRIP